MTLAGLLVPWVLDRGAVGGLAAWQLGWLCLTGLGVAATVAAVLGVRHTVDPAPPDAAQRRTWDRRRIGWLSAGYTLFGLGYIAYLTFIVAFLQDQGVGGRTIAAFWVAVGLAASVTAMTVGVRESLPMPLWTAGLAFATVAFGAGQTLGPWLTGWFSDLVGSLGAGLVVSAALLVVGAVLALPQRVRADGPGEPSGVR